MSKLKYKKYKARNSVTYHQVYMDVYTMKSTGINPKMMATSPFILW